VGQDGIQDGILRGDCPSPRGPIVNRPAGCLPANLPHIGAFDAAFFLENEELIAC
jgi:hypothetical protein